MVLQDAGMIERALDHRPRDRARRIFQSRFALKKTRHWTPMRIEQP